MKLSAIFLAISASFTFSAFANTSDSPDNEHNEAIQEHIVVTATREQKPASELTESVGVLTAQAIANISPSHPSEALNRVSGVYVNNLGGEGHMTSIRQPITTSGVYLFLEDGIPTRPTGFFNHNGLYEINIPQTGRVEVTKGPGSALYGSDAIGGIINSITLPATDSPSAKINAELGSYGWTRLLTSASGRVSDQHKLRASLNISDNQGYRDNSDYQRISFDTRIDSQLSNKMSAKTVLSYSDIEQSGTSSLEYDDYINNPKKNLYGSGLASRELQALRLSSEINYQISDQQLFSIIPFYRHNEMSTMPSWMLSYDPNVRTYQFDSYGALIKFRQNLANNSGEIILGVDLDHTPSKYDENEISVEQSEQGIYTDYQLTGEQSYAFEAEQNSISPYIHTEYQFNPKWRATAGLRYDYFEVDYTNQLTAADSGSYIRPESQRLSYDNLSPKLGLVYKFADKHNAYLSYRHAFRAPTVGSLFRPGSSTQSTELKPTKSVSYEIGFRGLFNNRFKYELALYDMNVTDDIVSIIEDNTRISQNAGETRHQGIELGLDVQLADEWQLGTSLTYTKQTYQDFAYVQFSTDCYCNQQINFAGNDLSKAPKTLANMRIAYYPQYLAGFRAELEWVHLGKYFTDQTNTQTYGGHELLNLRTKYEITQNHVIHFKVNNLTDKTHSTYVSNQVGDSDLSYRPGRPRSFNLGYTFSF